MDGLSTFKCSQCQWECSPDQAGATHDVVKLWENISGSLDIACVSCPNCAANLIQCRHCQLNFCEENKEIKQQLRTSKVSILELGRRHFKRHFKKDHQIGERKRRSRSTRKMTKRNHTGDNDATIDDRFLSFKCPSCSHICLREDNDQRAREAWDLISEPVKGIAEVVCPSCHTKIIQCCKCPHNLDPFDRKTKELCSKEKRSPTGYMINEHVRRAHPVPSAKYEENDDVDFRGNSSHWDNGDDGADNYDQMEVVDVNDYNPRNDDMDDSRHSFHSFYSEGKDRNVDDGADLCNVFDDMLSSEEEGFFSDDEAQFDPEAELAQEYVHSFQSLNLDPNKEGDDEDEDNMVRPDPDTAGFADGKCPLTYADFTMFDNRLDEDKYFKRSGRMRLCQNQLYFYQSYLTKGGGFRGLVARANKRNREDSSAMAGLEEGIAVFLMFKVVLDMTQTQQEDFVRYQKKIQTSQNR